MSDPTRSEAAAYRAAAPDTLVGLHTAIKARMQVIADGFWPLATKTTERAPTVIDGWLPPKTPEGEQYPFILVRPRGGTDSPQGAAQDSTVRVDLIVGTYRDADDGFLEVLQVVDAIRLDLAAQPNIIDTAFEQTGPLTWDLLEQHPRPQWLGTVSTTWTIPRPRRIEARNPPEE